MDKPPLTADDLYKLEFLSDPQISPDGRWVAFVRQRAERAKNAYRRAIWLLSTAGNTLKQFTAGTHRDSCPRWSPDGRQLAFISDRADDKPQLYLIPVDGGEARQLTHMSNGVEAPAWSPDGKHIAFLSAVDAEERAREDAGEEPPDDPDERELWEKRREQERAAKQDPRSITRFPYRAGTSYLEDRYPHIYIVDVEGGKPHRITDGDRVYGPPEWTSDGTAIVATVNRDPASMDIRHPTAIVRIPTLGGEPKVIIGREEETYDSPRPSPDGKWIAYRVARREYLPAQNWDIAVIPADGGEPRVLTESLDAVVSDFCWSEDGEYIYLTFAHQGNAGIHRLTMDGDVEQVIGGRRVVVGFDVGAELLAYVITAPHIPADLYTATPEGKDEKRHTEVNGSLLAERWLSTPQEVRYTRPDGTRIQGWVMHPPDFTPDHKYPLVVEIHGGPHAMWGNTFWHEFQVLAGRGYVVFFCNPRGSDGYGFHFRSAVRGRWGEADADDILAGVNGLIKRGYIDEDCLFITGGSYGGFMTAWIIGHDRRFRAAVSQRGVYELVGFYGLTDVPDFLEAEFETLPWKDVDVLWQHSPLAYVEQIETPLLILHSEQDYRVPIASGEMLYTALKRLRREVVLVRYPREGHELSRSGEPKHRIDRIRRIAEWFDQHA